MAVQPGSAADWENRERIVDHPGPFRLRLVAAGTAEEILDSLFRVISELENAAPDLRGLNAGSALCDWDIQEQPATQEARDGADTR